MKINSHPSGGSEGSHDGSGSDESSSLIIQRLFLIDVFKAYRSRCWCEYCDQQLVDGSLPIDTSAVVFTRSECAVSHGFAWV